MRYSLANKYPSKAIVETAEAANTVGIPVKPFCLYAVKYAHLIEAAPIFKNPAMSIVILFIPKNQPNTTEAETAIKSVKLSRETSSTPPPIALANFPSK